MAKSANRIEWAVEKVDTVQAFVYTDAVILTTTFDVGFPDRINTTDRTQLTLSVPAQAEDIMVDGKGVTVTHTSVGPLHVHATRLDNLGSVTNKDNSYIAGGDLVEMPGSSQDIIGSVHAANRVLISRETDIGPPSLVSLPTKEIALTLGVATRAVRVHFDPSSIGDRSFTAKLMVRYRLPAVPWSFLHMLQFDRPKKQNQNNLVENLPEEVAGRLTTKVQVDFRYLYQSKDTIRFTTLSFINKALGTPRTEHFSTSSSRRKSMRRSAHYGEELTMEKAAPAMMAPEASDSSSSIAPPLRADSEGEWNFANVTIERMSQLSLLVSTSDIKLRYLNTIDGSSSSSDQHPETCLLLGQDDQTQTVLAQLESGRLVVYRGSLLLSDSKTIQPTDKVIRIGPMTSLRWRSKAISDNAEERFHEERLEVFNKAAEALDFTLVVPYSSEVKVQVSPKSSKKDAEWISYRPSVHVTNPNERTIYVPLTASPSGVTRVVYRRYE